MSGWFRRFRLPPPPLVLFRARRPSAFLFPCPFRVCPLRARCVGVCSLSLFFCVPLFAFLLSNLSLHFHVHLTFIPPFIPIFTSFSMAPPCQRQGVCMCVCVCVKLCTEEFFTFCGWLQLNCVWPLSSINQ